MSGKQAKKQIINLLEAAKQKSYECNDDYMSALGETEPAVMYMMNSADLYEKVNLSAGGRIYIVLEEMPEGEGSRFQFRDTHKII